MSGSKSEAHLESVNADLVDSIECRMRERLQQCGDHVTFAELRLVEEFAGDHAIFFPNANNVILWTGMSLEAIEALIRIGRAFSVLISKSESAVIRQLNLQCKVLFVFVH